MPRKKASRSVYMGSWLAVGWMKPEKRWSE
jgi:hypothetical protein